MSKTEEEFLTVLTAGNIDEAKAREAWEILHMAGFFIGKLKPTSEATKEDKKQRRVLLIDPKNDRRKHPLSRIVVGAHFNDGIDGPEWAVFDYFRNDHTDFEYAQPEYFMSLEGLVIPASPEGEE